MKARRLDNEFELRGKWWIGDGSNLPDDAVSGSLQFEPAGDISLSLDGHLAQENPNDLSSRMRSVISSEPFRTPAILGFSPEGERYALIGVLRTEAMFSMHGYPRSVFEGTRLVIGKHVVNPDVSQFKSASMSISGLEESMNLQGFSPPMQDGDNLSFQWTNKQDQFEISIPPIKATLKGRLLCKATFPGVSLEASGFAVLELTPEVSVNLDWITDQYFRLANLMSLLNGFPSCATSIEMRCVDDDEKEAHLYLPLNRAKVPSKISYLDVLIPLCSLKHHSALETVVNNWFELPQDLRDLVELFIGIVSAPHMYTRLEFLVYCQILESFHRSHIGGEHMTRKDFACHLRTMAKAIPEELTQKHRERVRQSLSFAYELTAADRITELLATLPANLAKHVTDDQDLFVRKIVATRNYLTHYPPTLREKSLDENSMAMTNYALRNIIRYLFLSVLAVPAEFLCNSLERTKDWRAYSQVRGVLPWTA